MTAILQAIKDRTLDAQVSVVVSNNPEAPALEIARSFGVPAVAVSHRGLSREAHELQVIQALSQYKVDYVVLAGYMRVLTSTFLNQFRDPAGHFRIINIHPSLLPAFPGANGYEDAFAAGVNESGVTVHLVDELVDHGPILAQEKFRRLDDDTIESFKQRGLAVEHQLLPSVLQTISKEGIRRILTATETSK
jgi:formyltetrahydrofolate-dependent phosphoribosylglycinamide formyltransferase